MIRRIQPLENIADFNKLTACFERILHEISSFRFLSYSLIVPHKDSIENMTKKHKENGIEYIVHEQDEQFTGIMAVKRNPSQGFELFLLAVDTHVRQRGIGQSLIEECLVMAKEGGYHCIDTFVFSDNKNMLRLLIKNDYLPVGIQYHQRADGMDLLKLSKYL
jgi:ribosomal protein S18 acetylase RimI-like enzyme